MPVWEYYSTHKWSEEDWHPFDEAWAALVEDAWSTKETFIIIKDKEKGDGLRWILDTKHFLQHRVEIVHKAAGPGQKTYSRSIRRKDECSGKLWRAPGKPEEGGDLPGCTLPAFS